MDRIDFEARVEGDGLIRIPAQFRQSVANGETVHVTVSTGIRRTRLVERMLENPLRVDDATPLTREQVHDRRV